MGIATDLERLAELHRTAQGAEAPERFQKVSGASSGVFKTEERPCADSQITATTAVPEGDP